MNEYKDTIIVTVFQIPHEGEFLDLFDRKLYMRYLEPEKQLEQLREMMAVASQENADFAVLPEFYLPHACIRKIEDIAQRYEIIIISGLDYRPQNLLINSKTLVNEAVVTIPYYNRKYREKALTKKGKCGRPYTYFIPKLNAAPKEIITMANDGYRLADGHELYVFHSKFLGSWAVLVCYDFLNLPVQKLLQGKIQTLFVVSYNQDVDAFAAIADTVERLLLCNVVVCNTGCYGSSLAFSPYRKRHKRYALKVVGNHVKTAVTVKLPMKELIDIQSRQRDFLIKEDEGEFLKRPPYFGF
jgi:predicted amidohydrolase